MIIRNDGKKIFTFNIHTHAGRGSLLSEFTGLDQPYFWVDDIVRHMDDCGVDKAAVFAISEQTDYKEVNLKILEDAKKHQGRIIPFVRIDPHYEQQLLDDLELYYKLGAKGIKLHPMRDGFFPVDSKKLTYPMYEFAAAHKLPVIIHTAESWCNMPGLISNAAYDFPEVTFIMAHCGLTHGFNEAVNCCRRQENIYLDITELWPPTYVRMAVRTVGKEKVMWGSDDPYWPMYTEIFKWLYFSDLSDEEIEYVAGLNACRLLNVPVEGYGEREMYASTYNYL